MKLDRRHLSVASMLIVVALFNDVWWPIQAIATAGAVAGLLFPNIADRREPWFALTGLLAAAFVLEWWATDNHHWLIILTCLLFGIAVGDSDRETILADGARWLIAATFGAAVLAKLVSPDYLSGDFGQFTFLFDSRLEDLATRSGALSESAAAANRVAIEGLQNADTATVTPVAGWLAGPFTAWALLIEVVIVAGYASPARWRLARLGDAGLLAFIASTYSVVPVTGFAGALCVLGFAQAKSRLVSWLFLAAFIAIPVQQGFSRAF